MSGEWEKRHDEAVDLAREICASPLIKRKLIQDSLGKSKCAAMAALEKQFRITPRRIGRDVYWRRADLVRVLEETCI